MTNKNKSLIVTVLDRSGSMQTCKEATEQGMREFITAQRKLPGDVRMTLVQFDTQYEEVFSNLPVTDESIDSKLVLEPRGGTALYDAMCRAIDSTGAILAALPEYERPGLVVFAIITDGGENASREFKVEDVRRRISTQTSKYNWQFTYLGANQDAIMTATTMGIAPSAAANYDVANTKRTWSSMNSNVMRMQASSSMGQSINCGYSTDERQGMVADPADPNQQP